MTETIIENDPFGGIKGDKKDSQIPATVINKAHAKDDVDTSSVAHHHTLGIKTNQAAPGHHKHDGRNSKKLLEGVTISGSKAGNVALASVISALVGLGATDITT